MAPTAKRVCRILVPYKRRESIFLYQFCRVPHSCAFSAQEWDSTKAASLGISLLNSPAPLLLSREFRRKFVPLYRRIPLPDALQNAGDLGRVGGSALAHTVWF